MAVRPVTTAPDAPDIGTDIDDTIEPGKRLIRLPAEKGLSLGDRIANHITRLTWRTPLHAFRLKGRFPLKLLGVPDDPVPGDTRAGTAIRAGHFLHRGLKLPLGECDFADLNVAPAFADYLHSFAWLRDLAATGSRADGAPIAEAMVRNWLAAHGETVSEPAWRADNAGWRILYWAFHAPLILSSSDLIYRSAVLNHLARAARHLDRVADKTRPGVGQLVAWTGIVAASLLMPGGEPRQVFGEAGLRKVLETSFYADGGNIARSPQAQLDAIMALAMLARIYDMRRMEVPPFVQEVLARAVPALLGLVHADGGMGSWQGSGATSAEHIRAIVTASGVRTRPLKQARDWGYQRLVANKVVLLADAAPPPIARVTEAGCASTLAFELSDGADRIIVNCGGAALSGATIPEELARGLRTTAAHSTLTIADSNSTAILASGALGKGVTEVELDRHETPQGSRLEMSHDGYARRHGLIHRRLLILSPNGRELRGEDQLLPAPRSRRKGDKSFVLRFHLGPMLQASMTADKLGALLRIQGGPLWQFRTSEGALAVEESLWVDGDGRPHPCEQLVVTGTAPAGGASIGWIFKHIG
ncbi:MULTISPECIES: heparinase II/III family protein [unclassified Sphingopyxis]|uniref:heparinase II/III family protein n=1 Tax=unclassified Sphingopyxis TaxID=2614943 RepID=UPI0007370984|nr:MULTISPECIES: heparinase II/III family protein [unclassified Sphingopyxis]KTE33505.1 heparinase [Sphingopyxis sp. HIX]KTE83723.1 heparinase [Sphingopyxis sp. HXXIV]